MSEGEPKPIIPRLEDILTPQEAEILQCVDRGALPCPCCGEPLEGGKVVIDGVYEGVLLACLDVSDCGYIEP